LLIYTNELASGIYFVKVYDDTRTYVSSGKLVKN
jgi:hypothetical protein